MYIPQNVTLRNRQYSCGRKRYDMRFTSVKCGIERCGNRRVASERNGRSVT
jgi:hypothetical protein